MVGDSLRGGQIAIRGEAIYEEHIRRLIEDSQRGSFVVIDIETGDYEVDKEDVSATLRLLARHPGAVTYAVRIGYRAAYSLGGGLSPSEP